MSHNIEYTRTWYLSIKEEPLHMEHGKDSISGGILKKEPLTLATAALDHYYRLKEMFCQVTA